jgi:PhnB protein
MQIQPYLNFDGRCEEAIEYYRSAAGAEVEAILRFKDFPGDETEKNGIPPELDGKVMHSCFRIGDAAIMASDGHCQGKGSFEGVSLALSVPNETDAKRLFANFSDGGKVIMPLDKTFFSPCFGMVSDRFGVSWMINVVA